MPFKLMLLFSRWSPGRKMKVVFEMNCRSGYLEYCSKVHGSLTVHETESLDGCTYFTCGVRLLDVRLREVSVSSISASARRIAIAYEKLVSIHQAMPCMHIQ